MTLIEIEQKFLAVTAEKERNEETITNLRSQRASLFLDDSSGNAHEIDKLDKQIMKLQSCIDNFPSVITELERQLAAEQNRVANAERENLIEQQNVIAAEILTLSERFVELLTDADTTNILLRAALSGYHALFAKTGEAVLSENHCQGSADYLRVLLETMQMQLDTGQHTAPVGAGVIGSGVELRI